MRTRLGLLLLLLLAVVGTAIVIKSPSINAHLPPRPPQVTAEPGSLDAYVQEARAQGEVDYVFSAGIAEYVMPESWDNVLANYSLVVVEVVDARSYPIGPQSGPDNDIQTWYRFRVIETLLVKDITACSDCAPLITPPGDLAPAQENEILVPKLGGTIVRDGVNLTATEPNFPPFRASQRYLLILDLNPSLKLGDLILGPAGAYVIDTSGTMAAVNPAINPFQDDLTARYRNSLNQLRAALSGPPTPTPTPTPTPCVSHPIPVQRCEESGGAWDFETCRCY